MTTNIDYAATYFKYPTPTPINGEPTNKALKRLKNELRANASSVDTDLGGGDHGYLGLVLSDAEYANITPPPAPFTAPVFPAALTVPANATPVEAVNLREVHKENTRLYRECKNIEKSLLRHIQNAVEEKYIEHLVNEDTGLIEDDIPTVLTYLLHNYGKVPSEEVKEKEAEVLTMSFTPGDPMVSLFRPIEQLQKLAVSAKIPYSDAQILEFGLTIIRATRDFEKALGEWKPKPANDKTWLNFKSHFKAAQEELKEIRGPTMQQAGFHHANMLAAQMQENMAVQNEQVLAMMQTLQETQLEPPQQPAVNATVTDNVQLEILRLLQNLQQPTNVQEETGERRRRNRNRKTPDNASFDRAVTDKYCWTHGACNHPSEQCRRKAPGHRDEATMANKLNGSKAFCTPVE